MKPILKKPNHPVPKPAPQPAAAAATTTSSETVTPSSRLDLARERQQQRNAHVTFLLKKWSILLVIAALCWIEYVFAIEPISATIKRQQETSKINVHPRVVRTSLDLGDGAVLLDVREPSEYKHDGVHPYAIQLPTSTIRQFVTKLQLEALNKRFFDPLSRQFRFLAGALFKGDETTQRDSSPMSSIINTMSPDWSALRVLFNASEAVVATATGSGAAGLLHELFGAHKRSVADKLLNARTVYVICSDTAWRSQSVLRDLAFIEPRLFSPVAKITALKNNFFDVVPEHLRSTGKIPPHLAAKTVVDGGGTGKLFRELHVKDA